VIILSGVLVVVAIALLVTGIVTGNTGHEVAGLDGLKLIYVSIGVSIISALCLAIGVFLRRKELFGSAESATAKRSAASRSGKAVRPAKAKARVGAGDDAPTIPAPSATALDVPAETSVFVIPGRKRYHLETCRQLAGRDKEELTFVEAHEEGFTACTACLPDTALAARAALTETEPADKADGADARSTESLEAVADTADLRHPDDDPAQVTRTDLPVTRLETDTADTDIAEVQPAAESPAAAEFHDVPESSGSTETDESTDTSRFDEVDETLETTPEPAEEPSSARSRSFFEPLERPGTSPAEAEDVSEPATSDESDATAADTAEADKNDEDAEASPEPSEPEDAVAENLHEPEPVSEEPAAEEPAEPEDLHPSEPESAEDEPELAEAATAADAATESDHETPEPADAEADPEPATAGEEADDATDDTADRPDLPFVRILSGTKRYHRPDCALIEDIAEDADDLETLSPAEAKDRGCTPCLVCQPDKDPSDDTF
jgi:hypothetical protein